MDEKVPSQVVEAFRNNGYYVMEIPPYHGSSYAVVPKDEIEHPDDFDLNKMSQYDGFAITPLDQ